jgi:exosortase
LEATAVRTIRVPRLPLERIPVRAIGLVVSVTLAYNYSLQTLVQGLSLQTPLAYLALVPPIAFLLGAANFKLQPDLRPIHDRQLDWIIGLLLIGVAAVISILLPSAYSAEYWLHRLDMLGLPFFTAGMIALLYGVRRLWAMRSAVLFLLLAWPDPYVSFLASAIGASTDVALAVVGASLNIIPVAQPLGQGVFLINHGGTGFSLSVGSACSGINSLVGFFILGGALNTIFRGSLWRRVLWMAAGLMLVGLLNVVRIDLIFIAGWAMGEPFAIDVLHPVAGIIVFGVGAMAMLMIAPFFGLWVPQTPSRERAPAATPAALAAATPAEVSAALAGTASRPRPRTRKGSTVAAPASVAPVPAISSVRPGHALRPAYSIGVGLALALMLAIPNSSFAHYDSLVDAFGSPTLGTIDPASVSLAGWQGSQAVGFDQATQYFGSNGTWDRVGFGETDPNVTGPSTIYLDVIRTDDSGTLASYGVEACYNFHGFAQVASLSADVGAGVDAKLASFRSPIAGTDWTILWWEWPFNAGGQTRFERLVLLAPLAPPDQPGATTSLGTFQSAQTSLTSLARQIVREAMNDPAPTADPATQQ